MSDTTAAARTGETTDAEFLAAVAVGAEPSDHITNLRLAWLLVTHDPMTAGAELVRALERRARLTGGRVHRTRTAAWLAVVGVAATAVPADRGFEGLLQAAPDLLDRHLLDRYYDRATLDGPRAARTVVAPDRRPLRDVGGLAPAC